MSINPDVIKRQRAMMINSFIRSQDLHPSVLLLLARIFKCKAKLLEVKDSKSSRVRALEARLEADCLAITPLFEQLCNDQTITSSTMNFHEFLRKALDDIEPIEALEKTDLMEEFVINKLSGLTLMEIQPSEFSFQQKKEVRPNVESADSAAQQVVHAIESLKEQNREHHEALMSKLAELIKVTIARDEKQMAQSPAAKSDSLYDFENQAKPTKETGVNFNFSLKPNEKADPSLLYIFGSNKQTTPSRSFESLPSIGGKNESKPGTTQPISTNTTLASTTTNVFSNLTSRPTTRKTSTAGDTAKVTFGNMPTSPTFNNNSDALRSFQNRKINTTVTTTSITSGSGCFSQLSATQPPKIENKKISAKSSVAPTTTSVSSMSIFGGAQESIFRSKPLLQPTTTTTTAFTGNIFGTQSAATDNSLGTKPTTTTSSSSLFGKAANSNFSQPAAPNANWFCPSSTATSQAVNFFGPKTATISPTIASPKDDSKKNNSVSVLPTDRSLPFSLSDVNSAGQPPVLKTNPNTTFAGAGAKESPKGKQEASMEPLQNKTNTNDVIPSSTTTNVFLTTTTTAFTSNTFGTQPAATGNSLGTKPATTTMTTGNTFGGSIPVFGSSNIFGATKAANNISGGTAAIKPTSSTANSIFGSHAVGSVSSGKAHDTSAFGSLNEQAKSELANFRFSAPKAAVPISTSSSSLFGRTVPANANLFFSSISATSKTGNLSGPKTAAISPIVASPKDGKKEENDLGLFQANGPLSSSLSAANTDGQQPVLKTNQNIMSEDAGALVSEAKTAPNGEQKNSMGLSTIKAKVNCGIASSTDTNVFCAKDDNGWTALLFACTDGNLDTMKSLIEKGADMNAKNNKNETVLHFSVALDKMDMVAFLVEKGANLTVKDHNDATILHYAARGNKWDILKFLVYKGADVEAKDRDGNTVLHYAAQHEKWDVIKFLVDKGADVRARDRRRRTVLHYTALYGNCDIVKFLVDKGADVRVEDDQGETILHLVAKNCKMFMPYSNDFDIIKFLVEKGGDIEAKSNKRCTALHLAVNAFRAFSDNLLDSVKSLVQNGANVRVKDITGKTALHFASRFDHLDVVKFLVDNGADVNAQDNDGNTALHAASEKSNLDVIKFLIEKGVDVNVKNENGQTVLDFAIKKSDFNLVRYLIEKDYNANVRNKDKNGTTVEQRFDLCRCNSDIVHSLKDPVDILIEKNKMGQTLRGVQSREMR